MTREGPVDLRSAEQVSDSEPARRGQTDTGLKGRFYAPKTSATGSRVRQGHPDETGGIWKSA